MNDNNESVIDLTDSYCLANHNSLSDVVIVLDDTDESFDVSSDTNKRRSKRISQKTPTKPRPKKTKDSFLPQTPVAKIGECPICCERLGKKPVSSTNCGHIFCLPCLEKALRHDSRCPQCRKTLKGSSKYHRLYLPLETD
ncbi:unnamed protein product [Leptosia nina]|uniref:RING-type domain-containing protein n=1 Tax=Leptosia nina TaxID=320188 RepID=A0AAV1IUE1_9NEOP